jgi:hypothetical protein
METEKIPLNIQLPSGETIYREDLLEEVRISEDLDSESRVIGARIVRYGYLASYFSHQKRTLDDERKRYRAQFFLRAKGSSQVTWLEDGDVRSKTKPTEKEIEAAWRLDPETQLIDGRLSDADSSYELFTWLARAHQSKSAQITNLQRKHQE